MKNKEKQKLLKTGRDKEDITTKGDLGLKKDINGNTGVVLIKSVALKKIVIFLC